MRISVRSPITSSSARCPAAFQGRWLRPRRCRDCPALPRRPLQPRLNRGRGGALLGSLDVEKREFPPDGSTA